MSTTERATDVLTDEMLGRFDDRAPVYDRENRFFQEDFDELVASGYLNVRPARGPRRCRLDPGGGQPLAAPAGLPRPGHRPGREHAPVLGGPRRRPAAHGRPGRGLDPAPGGRRAHPRRRPRRGRQRHPRAHVVVLGGAGRRRLGDHRPQDLRQPLPRLDLPGRPRTRHERPCGPATSSTASCTATPPATTSRTPGTCSACAPPRHRTRCSTAPSSPTTRS